MMKKLLNICKSFFSAYKTLPAVIMLIMVLVPFVINFFNSNTTPLDNRPLRPKPTEFSGDFSKHYEDYYNDAFAYRKSILKRYVKLQKKLKIDTGRHFSGLDGWMFYDSAKVSDGSTIVDYKGEVNYTDAEMEKMLKGVIMARDFYAKRGIKYMLVIAPNKENVYSEFMPMSLQRVRKSDKSRADVVAEYIAKNSDVPVLNLKDVVIASKDNFPIPVYFKTDTHWNAIGAYLGYEDIAKQLNKMGIKAPIKKLTNDMIYQEGKISTDMDISSYEKAFKVKYLPNVNSEELLYEDQGKIIVYKADNAPVKKTVLMIRDSFAADLIPFVSRVFRSSVFIHRSDKVHSNVEGYLEEYNPDVVIDEVIERRVDKLVNYIENYRRK
ncbi:MAG: hypothetical protein LBL47_04400 [Lactobacillus sp.]|jgi:hypothetical protein|nr:hypothetical protein [Lactobacillus sp.]